MAARRHGHDRGVVDHGARDRRYTACDSRGHERGGVMATRETTGMALIRLGDSTLEPKDNWKVTDASDAHITRMRVEFPNGYDASIVRGLGTYGSDDGLFEGAVMRGDEGIVYDTPITNDVRGFMTAGEAIGFIEEVASLPVIPAATPEKAAGLCLQCGLQPDAPIHTGGHPARCHA